MTRNKEVITQMAIQQVIGIKPEITKPNPVGEIYESEDVKQYVEALAIEWDTINGKRSWWRFWKRSTAHIYLATNFLMQSLDGLVMLVDDITDLAGPDKKATVLNAANMLYDYVVREAIPIWLRPFTAKIKNYVIYTLASSAIDWMVKKYREGAWRNKTA